MCQICVISITVHGVVSQRKLYYFKSKLHGEKALVHQKFIDLYNLPEPKFVPMQIKFSKSAEFFSEIELIAKKTDLF